MLQTVLIFFVAHGWVMLTLVKIANHTQNWFLKAE